MRGFKFILQGGKYTTSIQGLSSKYPFIILDVLELLNFYENKEIKKSNF
jgi:hypothetical protein